MSRYEDDYRRRRLRSPDYAYAGSASHLPPDDDPPPAPSPPPPPPPPPPAGPSTSRQLLADEPYFSPPPTEPSNLQVPPDPRERPRSLPPPQRSSGSRRYRRDAYDDDADYYDDDYYDGDFIYGSSRGRDRARDRDLDQDRDRDRDRDLSRDRDHSDRRDKSPMSKAQLMLKDNFTDSTVGLGAGMLGALVGGLAAREAVDATSRHGNRRSSRAEAEAAKRNQAIATAVGAAMGALGANALGKRFEASREQQQQQQRGSRRRSGSRADSTGYGSPKGGFDVIERRELVRRPRSGDDEGGGGGAWDKDRDWADRRRESRGSGRGAMAREVDPDARSWRSVEEWVYDDRNDPPARRLEEGRHR